MWNRNTTAKEMVESAITRNEGRKLILCSEPQGEAIALKHDRTGFYTISEAKGEDNANKSDVPILYYSLSNNSNALKLEFRVWNISLFVGILIYFSLSKYG